MKKNPALLSFKTFCRSKGGEILSSLWPTDRKFGGKLRREKSNRLRVGIASFFILSKLSISKLFFPTIQSRHLSADTTQGNQIRLYTTFQQIPKAEMEREDCESIWERELTKGRHQQAAIPCTSQHL